MKRLDLKEIKNIELNLLKEFDELCEINNLYYTLCGGTLLGAVRHGGFIPWDDDIDVLMPRPDYDRLLNEEGINFEGLPDYINILSWKKGNLNFPFIKMTDSRTRISVDYYDSETNVKEIWIDIFPIDGNPVNEKELRKVYKSSIALRKILLLKLSKNGEGKSKLKQYLKPILKLPFAFLNIRKVCEMIDELAQKYDYEKSEYIGGIVWGYGPQERILKRDYLNSIRMNFENQYFQVPSNYEQYLKQLYGNYMELPPESKRVVHGIHAYLNEEEE